MLLALLFAASAATAQEGRAILDGIEASAVSDLGSTEKREAGRCDDPACPPSRGVHCPPGDQCICPGRDPALCPEPVPPPCAPPAVGIEPECRDPPPCPPLGNGAPPDCAGASPCEPPRLGVEPHCVERPPTSCEDSDAGVPPACVGECERAALAAPADAAAVEGQACAPPPACLPGPVGSAGCCAARPVAEVEGTTFPGWGGARENDLRAKACSRGEGCVDGPGVEIAPGVLLVGHSCCGWYRDDGETFAVLREPCAAPPGTAAMGLAPPP